MSVNGSTSDVRQFYSFERTDCDLPYYRGAPVGIGLAGWLIVLASVAVAFATLMATQPLFGQGVSAFVPALLFVLIPLATLAVVAGSRAPMALFRRIRPRDLGLIVGFFILNWIVTIAVGLLIVGFFHGVANPAADQVATASGPDQVLFFGSTSVQLLGEEIFTVLPFLAFLTLLDRHMPRKAALGLAALGAAIIFALIHLPTYQWNVPQALLGLVPVRIVLLMPFIITRNIWVSAGTHILNDWAIFGLALIGAVGAAA